MTLGETEQPMRRTRASRRRERPTLGADSIPVELAELIDAAIDGREDTAALDGVRSDVHELTAAFPLGSIPVSATE